MNIFIESKTLAILFEICYLKTNNKKSIAIILRLIMKADPLKAYFRTKKLTGMSRKLFCLTLDLKNFVSVVLYVFSTILMMYLF